MKEKLGIVKNNVTIPDYFYNIVMPQMKNYYNDYSVDFEVRPVAKCCLHDEDTPSFRYYDETNTFFCFGCRAGGDIIELHRKFIEKINGVRPSFAESVIFLYKYFIEGKESYKIKSDRIGVRGSSNKSTPAELIRLSGYLSKLESSMLTSDIDNDIKKSIWSKIDNISLLVAVNEIGATCGMEYIKHEVNKITQ